MLQGRHRLCAAAALAVTFPVLVAEPAAAQAVERRMVRTVHLGATYDGNAARGSDAVAAVRGLDSHEVLYTGSLSIDAVVPVGRAATFLRGSVGYEGHSLNSKLNSERIDLQGGVSAALATCQTSATGSWRRGKTRLDELNLRATVNTQQTLGASASVQCNPFGGFVVGAGANYSETSNGASQGVVDSNTRGAQASVGYGSQALGVVSLVGAVNRVEYTDDSPMALQPVRGVDSYNIGLRYSRPLGRKLIGAAGVGYVITEPDGPGADSNDFSADVSLTYRASPRLGAQVSYARNVTATILEGSSYVFNQQANASVSYRASARVSSSLGVNYTKRDYRDPVAPLPGLQLDEDEVKAIFGSVSLKIGGAASLVLDARYEDRTASVATFDYNTVRAGVSFTTTF